MANAIFKIECFPFDNILAVKKFAKLIRKHVEVSFFKKGIPTKVFSWKLRNILRKPFFIEHLRWLRLK